MRDLFNLALDKTSAAAEISHFWLRKEGDILFQDLLANETKMLNFYQQKKLFSATNDNPSLLLFSLVMMRCH